MSDPNLPSAEDVRGILKPYMDSSLERRAEELLGTLALESRHLVHVGEEDSASVAALAHTVIEQLLSENRQVRAENERLRSGASIPEDYVYYAHVKSDLDRISAEREAYREALEEISAETTNVALLGETPLIVPTRAAKIARRILAENDRKGKRHRHYFEMVQGGMACACGEQITAVTQQPRRISNEKEPTR